MSDESPELTRAREIAVKLDSLEKNLRDDSGLWEQYLHDCIRAYTRHVRETGENTEEMKETFSALAERTGCLTHLVREETEVSLADKMSVTEVLMDLSKQGIDLPEFLIRKENN